MNTRIAQVLAACLLVTFVVGAGDDSKKIPDKRPKTIRLEFDYADGAQKILSAVPWKKKMTLGDAMNFAASHKHGVKTESRGKGATAFLKKIDDLQNQGAAGRNWVFRVNGKLGDRSYAITPLNPGDTVLWKFDEYP